MPITIAVDAMGGDIGPSVTIPAALSFLSTHPDARVILVGRQDAVAEELAKHRKTRKDQVRIQHASEVVAMDEAPALAIRTKKDSSMRIAINLVKGGEADVAISAGNTGALMAISRFVLKMLPGIERPAIAFSLPTVSGSVLMLDLGANVDCSAEHLFQFAVLGSALVSALENIDRPSVGLLSIGEEDTKGNDVVKQTRELLVASDLNFFGNVEGNDIYQGTTDVVVCDGFVGNVALKTSEGLARMFTTILRTEFKRNLFTKFAAIIALPVITAFRERLDPRRYNGANLLGLRGMVIKSHGSADAFAFQCALDRAYAEANGGFLRRIAERLHGENQEVAIAAVEK